MYLIGGDFNITNWLIECFEYLGTSNNVSPIQAAENLSKLSLVEDKFITMLTMETERRMMFDFCEKRSSLAPAVWVRKMEKIKYGSTPFFRLSLRQKFSGKVRGLIYYRYTKDLVLVNKLRQTPIMDLYFRNSLDMEVSLKNLEEWRKKITVKVTDLEETLILWLEQGIINELLFIYAYSIIEERKYV